jgi:chemotaxis protein CheX
MKLALIQPFINAADAVLADVLHCSTTVGGMSMQTSPYRRSGIAAFVNISGDIEGHVVFDVDEGSAAALVSHFSEGGEPSKEMMGEAVCELANQVIGNAVVALNDSGFRFKVQPPVIHAKDTGMSSTDDTEALVMDFETPHGKVRMNIAMRYTKDARQAAAH